MPNSNRKHKIINFAVGRGLAPAVFCDTLTFFVSSGRGELRSPAGDRRSPLRVCANIVVERTNQTKAPSARGLPTESGGGVRVHNEI